MDAAYLRPTWRMSVSVTQPWLFSTKNSLGLSVFTHRRSIPGVVIDRGAGASGTVTISLGGGFDEFHAFVQDADGGLLPAGIEFDGGTFSVAGSPDAKKTIQEVALATFAAHDLPEGMEPTINADAVLDPDNFSYPHGTHLCAVEVDTETGMPSIMKYVAVDDVGNVINPQIVDGQVHGGLAQGIAQALYEEAVYDDAGNLTTGSLVDYYVPGAPDLPHYVTDRTVTPATSNPLGVKGVGEAGTIGSTPAVVNAVLDAVRHLGVTHIEMPCSPERVWRALQQGVATRDEIAPEGAEGGQHP